MPWRYLIDENRTLVTCTGWDIVTFDEADELQNQLKGDPRFNPDFFQLIDGTQISSLEINAGELKLLASRRLFSARSRRAVVMSRPAAYGMARMFQTYSELAGAPEAIAIFKEMSAALDWLGLPRSFRAASR